MLFHFLRSSLNHALVLSLLLLPAIKSHGQETYSDVAEPGSSSTSNFSTKKREQEREMGAQQRATAAQEILGALNAMMNGQPAQRVNSSYLPSLQSRGSMTTYKMACILQKAGVDASLAADTAVQVAAALGLMRFDPDKWNECSLLHFFTQIISESGAGAHLTQLGNPPPSKTGYGYLQVTGPDNLRMASQCMNKYSPPLGNNVPSDPEHTIGRSGDRLKAALASLCWWEANMVNNSSHNQLCTQCDPESARKVCKIVNTGSSTGQMSGGTAEETKRLQIFQKVSGAASTCTSI